MFTYKKLPIKKVLELTGYIEIYIKIYTLLKGNEYFSYTWLNSNASFTGDYLMVREGEEQLTVDLPKELMTSFRKTASEKFNYKRGYIKKAATEALELWLSENSKSSKD